MKKQIERSEAIIITFSVQTLIEFGLNDLKNIKSVGDKSQYSKHALISRGYKDFLKQIEFCNSDPEDYWMHRMGNKPVNSEDIICCYINILSKIRFKAKIIGFESAPKGELITKKFGDGRTMSGKNWILLHQFERIKEIKMGGFQGFRYWKDNYHAD